MLVWDANKNAANLRKHGYSFDDVETIFDHPVVAWEDRSTNHNEQRVNLLGWLHNRVMHLTYTDSGETIRPISLREAEKHEVRRYQNTLTNNPG